MAASVILLLGTAFVAWQRAEAQIAYETLSQERAMQETTETGVSTETSQFSTIEASLNKTAGLEPKVSDSAYYFKENLNKEWLNINPDFMGWLRVPGTNIDYPYVRGGDNDYYLKRDFYGKYSEAGTLFMDYRNLGSFNDQHTLIYGHNMKNKSMFHSLTYYHDFEFFEENQVIELSGLYETRTFKIFSVYEISADDYAFTLDFESSDQYQDYLEALNRLSLHSQKQAFTADPGQKLLTLVTCSYGVNNGRTIVHAVEIK
ncbi:class B sortase [Acidaminobacter hydrogenoformans]|nr:class B sortase [Acidaminobacter hydrogenoformans]